MLISRASGLQKGAQRPFGSACSVLPGTTLALSIAIITKDETAHYLICPLLVGIISQACGFDHVPGWHEPFFGNDINDITGALACAIGYHIYHSLKFGKMHELLEAIESSRLSYIRAYAFSTARAFINDFDIQSNGVILKCGRHFDPQRAVPLNSSLDQVPLTSHYQGLHSPDTPT